MSVKLTPIRLPDGSSYRYAVRDPIGVEVLGAAFRRGWNEVSEWSARSREVVEAEHSPTGLHNTLKIARGFLAFGGWPRPSLPLVDGSYLQGSDLASVTLSFVSIGDYTVSWDPLLFGQVAVVGAEPGVVPSGVSASGCKVNLFNTTGSRADFPFSLLIFGA